MAITLPEDLPSIDWTKEHWPRKHPIKVVPLGRHLIDYDTGTVLATVAPGYVWYWGHQHPHIAPEGWCGPEKGHD